MLKKIYYCSLGLYPPFSFLRLHLLILTSQRPSYTHISMCPRVYRGSSSSQSKPVTGEGQSYTTCPLRCLGNEIPLDHYNNNSNSGLAGC